MSTNLVSRRDLLTTAGVAALGAAGAAWTSKTYAYSAVPNSRGTEPPKLKAPVNACDCHHHICDATRFPPTWPGGMFQSSGRVEEYRGLQQRIGTSRNVVVTPAPYIGDNPVTLDAIARLGTNARGVALLRPDVTDTELEALNDGGIRAVRFSQVAPAATTTFAMNEPLSKRVAALAVQIYMPADRIAAAEDVWNRFPTPSRRPTPTRRWWLRRTLRQPRNAWCGAAIGPIPTSAQTRSRTTRCYLICSMNGRPRASIALDFQSRTRKLFTASQPRLRSLSHRDLV